MLDAGLRFQFWVGFEAIVQDHYRVQKSWLEFFRRRLLPQMSFVQMVESLRFQRPAPRQSLGILGIVSAYPHGRWRQQELHCTVDRIPRFSKSLTKVFRSKGRSRILLRLGLFAPNGVAYRLDPLRATPLRKNVGRGIELAEGLFLFGVGIDDDGVLSGWFVFFVGFIASGLAA